MTHEMEYLLQAVNQEKKMASSVLATFRGEAGLAENSCLHHFILASFKIFFFTMKRGIGVSLS